MLTSPHPNRNTGEPHVNATSAWIERQFALKARGSSVAAEARGAVATFLTMAYILFANPGILEAAGVPFASAVACTAAAAGICCLLMGFAANFPLALAPGMGLNAFAAYQIAQLTGSWQVTMGLIVLNGIVILVLVLAGLREAVMHAIPRDLRLAIGGGIGLFIAFIGLVNARIAVVPEGTLAVLGQNPEAVMPPVAFGNLANPHAAVAFLGLLLTAYLMARRVKGAIVYGILAAAVLSYLPVFGIGQFPSTFGAPDFRIAFQADILGALRWAFLPILFSFLMVDFFDTLGTVTAISEQSGLHDDKGRVPHLRSILVVDSVSASVGGLFGVSSVTSYVESASGVAEGARTGLHTVFVGMLFLLFIPLAPLASAIPSAATAPALILVGFLMMAQVIRIDFTQLDTAIPAFLTLITIPMTYSISHGIGNGFIAYVVIKVLEGRFRDVHPLMAIVSAAFALYFILGS